MNLEGKISPGLWDALKLSYSSGNYSAAIQDAIHYLSDILRAKSDLDGDGVHLVNQAFSEKNPRIKVTPLQSESDRNIQQGTADIIRGLYRAIRNPRSHGRVNENEQDAQKIILFIDYILGIIDASQSRFSLLEYLDLVLDRDFVATDHYAELLVNKLPRKYYMDTFFELFERRFQTDSDKLAVYFRALLKEFEPDQQNEVAQCVSDEFQKTRDVDDIMSAIIALGAIVWPDLTETPRIRIENKLIAEVRDGQWCLHSQQCVAGELGTCLPRILEHFELKNELELVIFSKLYSDDAYQLEYVYRYFLAEFQHIMPELPEALQRWMAKRLKNGDKRLKDALNQSFFGLDDGYWGSEVCREYKQFFIVNPISDEIREALYQSETRGLNPLPQPI
ncbi:MAG: hypothetical protein Fur0042_25000 [Cyanophyceae cyanobacterium]